MPNLEILIGRRPVSVRTRKRAVYRAWKRLVNAEARRVWAGRPIHAGEVRLTVVFLCADAPIDVDNVIKPIQDALSGVVYADDVKVTDVDCHRRYFSDPIDLARIPPLLFAPALDETECVYVRVEPALPLEDSL